MLLLRASSAARPASPWRSLPAPLPCVGHPPACRVPCIVVPVQLAFCCLLPSFVCCPTYHGSCLSSLLAAVSVTNRATTLRAPVTHVLLLQTPQSRALPCLCSQPPHSFATLQPNSPPTMPACNLLHLKARSPAPILLNPTFLNDASSPKRLAACTSPPWLLTLSAPAAALPQTSLPADCAE